MSWRKFFQDHPSAFELQMAAMEAIIERQHKELRAEIDAERVKHAADAATARGELDRVRTEQYTQIKKLQFEVDSRILLERQLRHELNDAWNRINAQDVQLAEERDSRARQLATVGYLQAQVDAADKRLGVQREIADTQGKKIAVLEEQNAVAVGTTAGLRIAVNMLTRERDAALARVAELEQQLVAVRVAQTP